MKVLLDECVPWPLHRMLRQHVCTSVQYQGWAGIKNGELLRLAEPLFDAFVTSDQNLRYQQNLVGRRLRILLLTTNDLRPLLAAGEAIDCEIARLAAGEFKEMLIPMEP